MLNYVKLLRAGKTKKGNTPLQLIGDVIVSDNTQVSAGGYIEPIVTSNFSSGERDDVLRAVRAAGYVPVSNKVFITHYTQFNNAQNVIERLWLPEAMYDAIADASTSALGVLVVPLFDAKSAWSEQIVKDRESVATADGAHWFYMTSHTYVKFAMVLVGGIRYGAFVDPWRQEVVGVKNGYVPRDARFYWWVERYQESANAEAIAAEWRAVTTEMAAAGNMSVWLPTGTQVVGTPEAIFLTVPTAPLRAVGITATLPMVRIVIAKDQLALGPEWTYRSTPGRKYAEARERECKDNDWGSLPVELYTKRNAEGEVVETVTYDQLRRVDTHVAGYLVNDALNVGTAMRVALVDGVIRDIDDASAEYTVDEYEQLVKRGLIESNPAVNAHFRIAPKVEDSTMAVDANAMARSLTVDNADMMSAFTIAHHDSTHHEMTAIVAAALSAMVETGVGDFYSHASKLKPADLTVYNDDASWGLPTKP